MRHLPLTPADAAALKAAAATRTTVDRYTIVQRTATSQREGHYCGGLLPERTRWVWQRWY